MKFIKQMIADVMALFGIYLYVVTSREIDDPVWSLVVGIVGVMASLFGFQMMIRREIREDRS